MPLIIPAVSMGLSIPVRSRTLTQRTPPPFAVITHFPVLVVSQRLAPKRVFFPPIRPTRAPNPPLIA